MLSNSTKRKRLRKAEADSPDQAALDRHMYGYDYEVGQFRKFYTTPFEQYAMHVGKPFEVLHRLPDAESVDGGDEPGEDMWQIRFKDGTEIEAWGHEISLLYDAVPMWQRELDVYMAVAWDTKKHFSYNKVTGKWAWCERSQPDAVTDWPFETFWDALVDAVSPYVEFIADKEEVENSATAQPHDPHRAVVATYRSTDAEPLQQPGIVDGLDSSEKADLDRQLRKFSPPLEDADGGQTAD